jgi:hypothetical protein
MAIAGPCADDTARTGHLLTRQSLDVAHKVRQVRIELNCSCSGVVFADVE